MKTPANAGAGSVTAASTPCEGKGSLSLFISICPLVSVSLSTSDRALDESVDQKIWILRLFFSLLSLSSSSVVYAPVLYGLCNLPTSPRKSNLKRESPITASSLFAKFQIFHFCF